MAKKSDVRLQHDLRGAISSLYGLIELLRSQTIDFQSKEGQVALAEAEDSLKLLEKTLLNKASEQVGND